MLKRFSFILIVMLLLVGVVSAETSRADTATTVTYTASSDQFANPERGFYHFLDKYSTDSTVWWSPALAEYRTDENITLVYCVFILDSFKTSDISPAFLTTIEENLASVRDAGLKCVLRFAYTYTQTADTTGDGEPDPPYGDADKAQILSHITQLGDLIEDNSDVILVWQAGFIGIWGEWYFTDYFVNDPAIPWQISDTQQANRYEVLSAMLDVLPNDRMVQVRYPHAKKAMLNSNTALTAANAFDDSNRARIGFHNDCFLASDSDFGTFQTASDRSFMESETEFVPMGGETCNVNPPRSECLIAVTELLQFHYTFLNLDYKPEVLQSWRDGGCFDAIEKAMGYRLTLTSGTYQSAVRPGDDLAVEIALVNNGYAPPINPRPVKVVLDGPNGTFSAELQTDIRTWSREQGTITLNANLQVPFCVPEGQYNLLLHLPDAADTLAARPEYAIRLANSGVWQAASGYNDLLTDVTVSSSATASSAVTDGAFSSASCVPTAAGLISAETTSPRLIVTLTLLAFLLLATIYPAYRPIQNNQS